MAMSSAERSARRRAKLETDGEKKICVIFPIAYRKDLDHYVARKRAQWEKERNAL